MFGLAPTYDIWLKMMSEIPVWKQYRLWSDAVFCDIWSQSAIYGILRIDGLKWLRTLIKLYKMKSC